MSITWYQSFAHSKSVNFSIPGRAFSVYFCLTVITLDTHYYSSHKAIFALPNTLKKKSILVISEVAVKE